MQKFLNQTVVFIFIIASTLMLTNATAQTPVQTGRQPQFENAEAKVWKSIIVPGKPLPLHRHDHPRVLTALTGGTMKIVEEDGKSETHHWEAGKSYWLPANPPGTLHTDENVSDHPIEVMVVELKNAY